MKHFISRLNSVIEFICKVMLCIQVVSVMCVVLGRYILNRTPVWGEELTLFCLVWVSLIGAYIPLCENSHLRMTIFDSKLSPRALFALELFGNFIIFIFSVTMFVAGIIQTQASAKTILHGIKISKGFLYAAVPVSMFLYMMASLENIVNLIKNKRGK